MTEQQDASAIQRRNRVQMIIILAVALVSLGGSYLLFFITQGEQGWGTTNNGEWVTGEITTTQLGWSEASSAQAPGTWWLWMLAGDCDTTCQGTAKNLRALHILLNREADRVKRGYSTHPSQPRIEAMVLDWQAEYPKLETIEAPGSLDLAPGVYIIDPHGNLVFRYPLDTEPKPVLQDLKKLLKVSQIG